MNGIVVKTCEERKEIHGCKAHYNHDKKILFLRQKKFGASIDIWYYVIAKKKS